MKKRPLLADDALTRMAEDIAKQVQQAPATLDAIPEPAIAVLDRVLTIANGNLAAMQRLLCIMEQSQNVRGMLLVADYGLRIGNMSYAQECLRILGEYPMESLPMGHRTEILYLMLCLGHEAEVLCYLQANLDAHQIAQLLGRLRHTAIGLKSIQFLHAIMSNTMLNNQELRRYYLNTVERHGTPNDFLLAWRNVFSACDTNADVLSHFRSRVDALMRKECMQEACELWGIALKHHPHLRPEYDTFLLHYVADSHGSKDDREDDRTFQAREAEASILPGESCVRMWKKLLKRHSMKRAPLCLHEASNREAKGEIDVACALLDLVSYADPTRKRRCDQLRELWMSSTKAPPEKAAPIPITTPHDAAPIQDNDARETYEKQLAECNEQLDRGVVDEKLFFSLIASARSFMPPADYVKLWERVFTLDANEAMVEHLAYDILKQKDLPRACALWGLYFSIMGSAAIPLFVQWLRGICEEHEHQCPLSVLQLHILLKAHTAVRIAMHTFIERGGKNAASVAALLRKVQQENKSKAERAETLRREGQWAEAVALWFPLASEDITSCTAFASVLLRKGKLDEAKVLWEAILQINPFVAVREGSDFLANHAEPISTFRAIESFLPLESSGWHRVHTLALDVCFALVTREESLRSSFDDLTRKLRGHRISIKKFAPSSGKNPVSV